MHIIDNRLVALVIGVVVYNSSVARAESDASIPSERASHCEAVSLRLSTAADGHAIDMPLAVGGPDAPATTRGGSLVIRFAGSPPGEPWQASAVQYRTSSGDWNGRWITRLPECEDEQCREEWFELIADIDSGIDVAELTRIYLRLTEAHDIPSVSLACLNVSYQRRRPGEPAPDHAPVSMAPKEGAPTIVEDASVPPADGQAASGSEGRDFSASGSSAPPGRPDASASAPNAISQRSDGACQLALGSRAVAVWLVPFGFGMGTWLRRRSKKCGSKPPQLADGR